MAPEQYKSIRRELDLTQDGLAAILGVSRKTINFREKGSTKITEEARLAIQSLKKTGRR